MPAPPLPGRDDPEAVRLQYQLTTEWLRHLDERRWAHLNVFVLVNSLLVAAIFLQDVTWAARVVLAGVGIANSAAWLLLYARNAFYRWHVECKASIMEAQVLGPSSAYRLWDGRRPGERGVKVWFQELPNVVVVSMLVGAMTLWAIGLLSLVLWDA